MGGDELPSRRSLRVNRKPALSSDFVLDIDKEIMAIESAPGEIQTAASSFQSILGHEHGNAIDSNDRSNRDDSFTFSQYRQHDVQGKKKRGRPRKHPPAVALPQGLQNVVKRPRGRPRGSGKHQRAAAAAAVAGSSMNNNNNNNTNPTASDSAVTSGGVFAPPTGSQKREQLSVFTAENLSATPPALKFEQQHRRDEELSDLKEWSSSSDKQKLTLLSPSPLPTQCGNIIGFENTGTPKRTPRKQNEEPLETPVGLRSSSKNRRKGSQPKKTEI